MKANFPFKTIATIFVTVVPYTGLYAQGDLAPPAGAPAPTMKSLGQLEPRTPISSLPYTIKDSGSYYLTGNLASTTNGIVIHADNVSLDLMGFTLSGDGGAESNGIHVEGSSGNERYNLVIRGGMVSGFQYGLNAVSMNTSRIEHLVVAPEGECNGNAIVANTINGNVGRGINLYANMLGGGCDGNTIRENTIRGNVGLGISLVFSAGNRIEDNNISDTTGGAGIGIKTSSSRENFILKNTSTGNSTPYDLDSDDTFGPHVSASGSLTGTNPWANFSR